MKRIFLFSLLAIAASVSLGLLLSNKQGLVNNHYDDEPSTPNVTNKNFTQNQVSFAAASTTLSPASGEEEAPTHRAPEAAYPDYMQPSQTVQDLRDGRLYGDARTPPLSESIPHESPPEDILNDPEKYAEYEQAQTQRVYQAYVNASVHKLQEIDDAIAEAESIGGVSPEEIAAAQEKRRLIAEMRDKLLADNPNLTPPSENSATSSSTLQNTQ